MHPPQTKTIKINPFHSVFRIRHLNTNLLRITAPLNHSAVSGNCPQEAPGSPFLHPQPWTLLSPNAPQPWHCSAGSCGQFQERLAATHASLTWCLGLKCGFSLSASFTADHQNDSGRPLPLFPGFAPYPGFSFSKHGPGVLPTPPVSYVRLVFKGKEIHLLPLRTSGRAQHRDTAPLNRCPRVLWRSGHTAPLSGFKDHVFSLFWSTYNLTHTLLQLGCPHIETIRLSSVSVTQQLSNNYLMSEWIKK